MVLRTVEILTNNVDDDETHNGIDGSYTGYAHSMLDIVLSTVNIPFPVHYTR